MLSFIEDFMPNKKLSFYTLSRQYDSDVERVIKNVYDQVDEIVVILNNSMTARLSKSVDPIGKVVIFIKKHTYFPDMRNYALSKVHGDWVCWLDSDEIFSEAFLKKMRGFTNQDTYDGYKLKRIHFYKTPHHVFDAFSHLRLCKVTDKLKYVGIVHELLMGVSNRRKLRSDKQVIYHFNKYSDIKAKNLEYLTLLEKEYNYALKIDDKKLIELAEFRIWCNRNIDNVDKYYDRRAFNNVWRQYKRRLEKVLAGQNHYHLNLHRLEKAHIR